MSYLMDTHTFIWGMEDSSRLNPKTKSILKDKSNLVFLSVASVWEIIIKVMLKKLTLKTEVTNLFNNLEFEMLPIKLEHTLALLTLPPIHKDPFDRMLVAQSQSEHLILLTVDSKIKSYF